MAVFVTHKTNIMVALKAGVFFANGCKVLPLSCGRFAIVDFIEVGTAETYGIYAELTCDKVRGACWERMAAGGGIKHSSCIVISKVGVVNDTVFAIVNTNKAVVSEFDFISHNGVVEV